MFASVLIANRGEIACRIIRTAKRLGLRTIAVYSAADAFALHVRQADEAHLVGPPPARESYLDIERILDAAVRSGAECIHPGYGFLSENPDFAQVCRDRGIVFVGPPAEAIRAMGHKDAAKVLMSKAGVPVVPGYHGESQAVRRLAKAADEIGYPVMIKAVAGGGGKGMRRVDHAPEFIEALAGCRREAASAFGDERVLIEKFIADPRHIEVQIIGDEHGNCLHLHERDCSLQRRHQKVIEEAPAPKLPSPIRQRMCDAAVAAARAVSYVGAGTVEFIAGTAGGGDVTDFYFLEMNTRLQVEHPVTEMILGVDLVELQLKVAAGEPLPFSQDDVAPTGHAFEARVYAENPASGFLPQTGLIRLLKWPEENDDLRIDTGVEEGSEITSFYDPIIAKVIARGATRKAAAARLGEALRETIILGLTSNLGFLSRIIDHSSFLAGGSTTGFIDAHLSQLIDGAPDAKEIAAVAGAWIEHVRAAADPGLGWEDSSGWSLAGLPRKDILPALVNGEAVTVEVSYERNGPAVAARRKEEALVGAGHARPRAAFYDKEGGTLFAAVGQRHVAVRAEDVIARTAGPDEGAAAVHAPMPGRVIAVLVELDQSVKIGQPLIILDAMKMEHTLKAALDGTVRRLPASTGSQVKEGDLLCLLEPANST